MGWSCTAAASRRLDSWRGVCVASTGSQNSWDTDRGRLFFELGPERADGGIGGEVWAFDDVGGLPVGFFSIEHDGSVSEWPYGLRELVNSRGCSAELIDHVGNALGGCPVCGSYEVTGDAWDMETDVRRGVVSAWQSVACHGCGSSWDDVYTLTGRENVRRGERVDGGRS